MNGLYIVCVYMELILSWKLQLKIFAIMSSYHIVIVVITLAALKLYQYDIIIMLCTLQDSEHLGTCLLG